MQEKKGEIGEEREGVRGTGEREGCRERREGLVRGMGRRRGMGGMERRGKSAHTWPVIENLNLYMSTSHQFWVKNRDLVKVPITWHKIVLKSREMTKLSIKNRVS